MPEADIAPAQRRFKRAQDMAAAQKDATCLAAGAPFSRR
jgi:hypothetical protein